MSVASVQQFIDEHHADIRIFRLDESGATVEEAAATLGVSADAIAKTLSFHQEEGAVIIVMSGDARVDNKKFKAQFGQKPRMLSAEEVEPLTGHPVGGVCPFGLKEGVPVYLDESLRAHEVVYPAAGSRFHAMKVRLTDLEALTGGNWVNVCKKPEPVSSAVHAAGAADN